MQGVCKRFGATIALDRVRLEVLPGEVHALVGENGAGKSTLMKILAGSLRPDAGKMLLDGDAYQPASPQDARHLGISMIYQELNLAGHLTVEQNITLGMERTTAGFVRPGGHRRRISDVLALLHCRDIQPNVQVRRLSVGAQQLVEIARALMIDARIVVMDEPTSSLALADIEHLFAVIPVLKQRGVSVIYISHFLEEVQRVADRFTVLRDGRAVGTGEVAATGIDEIIGMMVGRQLAEMFPRVEHAIGEPVLELSDLAGRGLPSRASLTLHRGEIIGIAGLVGAGRTEMLRTIFGLQPIVAGTVKVMGLTSSEATPAQRLAQSVGMLSEDRKTEGLAQSRPLADNITLSHLKPFRRWGWLNLNAMRQSAERWIGQLRIRAAGPNQRVLDLSGGNQQKVAVARLLHHDVDVLLLDEPTRGIDVGSKVEIYRLIGQLARQGKAILIVSSYLPELLGICDRIAVMHRGVLSQARPASQWSEHSIMTVATSGREQVA